MVSTEILGIYTTGILIGAALVILVAVWWVLNLIKR